jgi:hypothetical protein
MSLQIAAQHLQAHGRGGDDQLVHMTTGELASLQKLAQSHGGSLTINPHTGLPEAGFLSSILPVVAGLAGAAMGIPTWALVGGVGLADAALTGSLSQGLMAGLGAWSGGSLAEGFSAIGDPNAPFNAMENSVQNAGTQNIATDTGMGNTGNFVDTTGGGMTTPQGLGINPSSPDVTGGITGSGQAVNTNVQNAFPSNASTGLPGDPNAPVFPKVAPQVAQQTAAQSSSFLPDSMQQNWNKFSSGFDKATGSWDQFKDFASNNKWPLIGVGTNVAGAALEAMRQPIPTAEPKDTNPMHLKINPQWTGPTQPAQPNPYYKEQYRNYVQNPYNPATGMAGGGVMNVNQYAHGDKVTDTYSEALNDFNKAVELFKPSKSEMPSLHASFHSDPAIVAYGEDKYRAADPYQRAIGMLQDLHSGAFMPGKSPIQSAGGLGSIPTDPALISQQQIEQQSQRPAVAKEGGLMHHSMGGLGSLGSYSDGGRLLKGPGDGVSDSIPASIGHHQPARLAEGEFVIPARIVSELGNGSTDAGAKRLYAMMDRVKAKRAKTKNIAADTKAYKYLPA